MFSYQKPQSQLSFFASRRKLKNCKSFGHVKPEKAKQVKKVSPDKSISHCVSPRNSMVTPKTIDLSGQRPKKASSHGSLVITPKQSRISNSPVRGIGLESGIYTAKKFVASTKQWDSISSSEKSVMLKDEPSFFIGSPSEFKSYNPSTPSFPEEIQKNAALLSKLHEEEVKYKRLEEKYKKLLSNYKQSEKVFENELNIIYRQRKLMNIPEDEINTSELEELDSYVTQLKQILTLAEDKAKKLCTSINNN